MLDLATSIDRALRSTARLERPKIQFLNLLDENEWPLFSKKPNYEKIWNMQKDILESIALGSSPETIIFCEHENVITKGRRSKAENILDTRIPSYEIERGGDVTLHHPGQLVIYPLLRLHGDVFKGNLQDYLRFCEEVIIKYLVGLGLQAGRFGPTGVWVKRQNSQDSSGKENVLKIASLGIAVRKWIAYHGISLNVSNDLSEFSALRPCDFDSSIMTSLANEGIQKSLDEVVDELQKIFKSFLGF